MEANENQSKDQLNQDQAGTLATENPQQLLIDNADGFAHIAPEEAERMKAKFDAEQSEAEKNKAPAVPLPAAPLPVPLTPQQKKELAAYTAMQKDAAEKQTKAAETVAKSGLFGNADDAKEFDLSKLVKGLTALPDDQVVIVQQKFLKQQNGGAIEDPSARTAMFVTPEEYRMNSIKDPKSGASVYSLLLGKYKVVHEPA